MTITITASTLCTLCNGQFTEEACQAIEEYLEQCGDYEPLSIGDICVSFGEISADWVEDDDADNVIATLDNGNVLIAY